VKALTCRIARVNDLHKSISKCWGKLWSRCCEVVLCDAKACSDNQQIVVDRVQIMSRIPNFPRKLTNIRDDLIMIQISNCRRLVLRRTYLCDRNTQGCAPGGDGTGLRHLSLVHKLAKFTWITILVVWYAMRKV
jgi:hypothetical protein